MTRALVGAVVLLLALPASAQPGDRLQPVPILLARLRVNGADGLRGFAAKLEALTR